LKEKHHSTCSSIFSINKKYSQSRNYVTKNYSAQNDTDRGGRRVCSATIVQHSFFFSVQVLGERAE